MNLRAEIRHPNATVDDVFALSMNPEFRAEVCEATHALEYDVSIDEHDDGRASVVVHRTMPAEVPDFVRRLVGDRIDIVQTEEWGTPDDQGRRRADLLVQIKGQPAQMRGSIVLESDGEGARQSISGDLTVSLPFIGRKIEPEIAKGIVAAVNKEQETGDAWLAGA